MFHHSFGCAVLFIQVQLLGTNLLGDLAWGGNGLKGDGKYTQESNFLFLFLFFFNLRRRLAVYVLIRYGLCACVCVLLSNSNTTVVCIKSTELCGLQ